MLKDIIKEKMIQAMKDKETDKKMVLSCLLSALQLAEKTKREDLTEDESIQVVQKELKQAKETLSTANGREDIIQKAEFTINILKEFAPREMSEKDVLRVIKQTIEDLNIQEATIQDKGKIMKAVMSNMKNRQVKANGSVVGDVLTKFLNGEV
jgi:uncharacterized protein YqeY